MSGTSPTESSRFWRAMVATTQAAVATVQCLGGAVAAWLDLAIRFWLAQALLSGAAVTIMMHAPLKMAGQGPWVASVNHVVASPLGMVVQTICPILLLVGLFSRLAAIPLLVQATLLHEPGPSGTLHLFWSMLLGWIVVMGPGSFSIDALLSHGLDSSAIPGATRLRALLAGITRFLGPWFRLTLRLWIATAPVAAATIDWAGRSEFDPLSSWLAMVPGRIAILPPGLSLIVGVLLGIGLGTRACASVLLLAIPLGQIGMAFDDRLYWTLLLGILVCNSPGPLAFDHWLAKLLAAQARRMQRPTAGLPHVVIVGGGFGGVAAAHGLNGAPCRITLNDARNHHVFQPLLYQVATAGLSPADVATPIRSRFRTQDNVRVQLATVRGISPDDGEVTLDAGSLFYDYLVLATGSRHSYFGRAEWAADAPGLKSIEDATEIRRRLLVAFERAQTTTDVAERVASMTFVIVGGGPTGVELAGAIAELARNGLRHEFRDIDPSKARVIVLQSAPRLLPTFPESLASKAAVELRRLGVEIRTASEVELVDARGVVVGGARIEARTVLWAAGVEASRAGAWLKARTDRAGRVVVGPDLSVSPHHNIFAIGDTAASTGWNGKSVPGLAPAAKQAGSYVAKTIRARLKGRPAPRPFRYRHAGSLATIGRRAAVAEFGPIRIYGALAWWVWGTVHILFLAGGRNRASVMFEWAWAYLTDRRGSRLITNPPNTR